MKIKILFIIPLFAALLSVNCASSDESVGSPTSSSSTNTGDCPSSQRTGAICNDGTRSTATGSGACSSHGGVKTWICK